MRNLNIFFNEKVYKLSVFIGVAIGNLTGLLLIFRHAPFLQFLNTKILLLPLVAVGCIMYPAALVITIKRLNKNPFYRVLLKIIVVVAALFVLGYFYINILDINSYSNFVFSSYYIYLPTLRIFSILQFMVIAIGVVYLLSGKRAAKRNLAVVSSVLVLLILLISYSIFLDLPRTINGNAFLIQNYLSSDFGKGKKAFDLGDLYDKMLFIENNTPADSVIFNPPQSADFPEVGNQALIRYFLFPRTLVAPIKVKDFIVKEGFKQVSIYYILASNDDGSVIFPDKEMKADLIVVWKGDMVKVYQNVIYDKNFVDKIGPFKIGVIKTKL